VSAVIFCLVIAIADGDTLTARCGDRGTHEQVKVRLAEIDAPEKAQPFANRSRQSLASLCFQEIATIRPVSKDKYGRTVARVECQGTDTNLHQAATGMAWAYTKYLSDPAIKQAEDAARKERAGLWKDAEPMAPWEWRKMQRSN